MLVVDSRFGKNGEKLIFLKTNSPKPFHNGLHGKCVDLILQEIVEVYLYHFDHAKLIWNFLIMILSIVYIKIDLLRENTNNDALAIKK